MQKGWGVVGLKRSASGFERLWVNGVKLCQLDFQGGKRLEADGHGGDCFA